MHPLHLQRAMMSLQCILRKIVSISNVVVLVLNICFIIHTSVIEIHWITQNCAVKEGAYVELCAEISSHALWKDVVAMVNISLNTGECCF